MKARFRGGRALCGRPAGRGVGIRATVVLVTGALWIAPAVAQDMDWEGLSERFAIGTAPGLMAAGGAQTSPSIACDTTLTGESWVIWQDQRLGDPDIFAARVTADGELRDPSGLPIAAGPDLQTTPRIATGGGVYLAVWQATDPTKSGYRLEGVRFAPDGTTLDEAPVLITESDYELQDLDLAFGATSFMVTWSDTLGDAVATRGVRVSAADGEVLDEEYLVLNDESNQQSGADIAFDGQQFLLAYSRQVVLYDTTGTTTPVIDTTYVGEIAGRFISAAGVPSEETIKIEAAVVGADYTDDDLPMLAFRGDRFLVVWPARDVGASQTTNREIFGRTLATDGTLSARFGIAQTIATRSYRNIGVGPGGYQLVWVTQVTGSRTTYYGVHVNSDGTQVSTESIIVPLVNNTGLEEPSGCAIAWTGTQYVFVGGVQYTAVAGDNQDIRMSWLDAAGTVTGGPELVSQATSMQVPRAMAYDGSQYLVVWDEQMAAGWQIHGAFVSTEGEPVGPSFAVLPETRALEWDPALASGNGNFVLTWTEGSNLYAVRLDDDGHEAGSRLLVGSAATGRAAVGWDGERFPVAWKFSSGGEGLMLSRVEYSGDGLALVPFRLVTEPGFAVETTEIRLLYGTCSDPGLTCSGEQNLILWAQKGFGVYGVQLPDTTTTWTNANLAVQLAAGPDPGVPRGVFDGTNYFIGWTDLPGTYAIRLRPDGLVLDPGRIPLDLESLATDRPAIATDGYNRLAIWRSAREDRWMLMGGRYGTDGLATAGTEVFAGLDLVTRWPLAVKGPEGQALLVYASYLSDAEHGALRLHGKLWQQQPPQIDIALHQNPGVTSDVGIIATPSEDLSQGSLDLRANGAPIDMELVDADHGVYQGWYQARATTVVRIVAAVGDSAGNVTHAERSFGIGEVSPGDGGFLAGPNGLVTLACPAQAVAIRSYVMILPDAARAAAAGTNGFLLSPPDLEFEIPAALTVHAPARPSEMGQSVALPILERQVGQQWERMPAQWNASGGTLRAAITQLGRFRVRWAEAGELPEAGLALSLGPAPWQTDLTFRYRLPQSGEVQLVVFDAAGRRVATLVNGPQEGGSEHTVVWNGVAEGGGRVGSGVYFAQLRCGGQTVTRRSIRVR